METSTVAASAAESAVWFDNTMAMSVILGFAVLFLIIDTLGGTFNKKGVFSFREIGVNIFSFINFLGIRVVTTAIWAFVFMTLLADYSGMLKDVNFWIVFPIYVLLEEYIHYWIHRWSHSIPWLWRLHKPHHAPEHLNMTVSFRENWLWFAVIPNPIMTAALIWAGQPEVAFIAVAWKGSSEWMVHTGYRWDLPLYENRFTGPIMRVVDKFITMPDTHHAHHGVGRYGHGMCNFGSFLFLFDVLHGTAEFPRHKQDGFGMPKGVKLEKPTEQLWWPVMKDAVPADLHVVTANESQGTRVFTGNNGRFSITM
ncbi:TPA: sterol desaturase family protein [Pseudomonas aeruginosa]|nr:sterol desaturase family protein [Pseudomonas aeruginosa]HCA5868829.1 sterol desaturase family protein [Pseudomonas aeruginosa]HCA7379606.1 sterol desaturase family protein [Pseudomonas aeruginosa]HCA7777467.1 sterol desaturase family protein [Pseudomonas aeruginosa]